MLVASHIPSQARRLCPAPRATIATWQRRPVSSKKIVIPSEAEKPALRMSSRAKRRDPLCALSSVPRLDLFYPLINDPDLINDPVAQLILAVLVAL